MRTTIADRRRLGYVGRQPGPAERCSDSWYTPERYLSAARTVLGGRIDLDPYTSVIANERVKARLIYTEERTCPPGREWPKVASVYMNPPYSGVAVLTAVERLIEAYEAERFKEAIVLTNNSTETRFFQRLLGAATAVCFTDHRISFENFDGKRVSGNTRGQAFFYLGKTGEALFREQFGAFGFVLGCR